MDKKLHNIEDDLIRAYQSYEDAPSPITWEKINAALDKEDADKYKKRFIGWKRIAVFLSLLLSGLIIHETEMLVKHSEDPTRGKKEGQPDPVSLVRKQENVRENTPAVAIRETTKKSENKNVTGNATNALPETAMPNKQNRLSRQDETSLKETGNGILSGSIVVKERRKTPESWHKINQGRASQKKSKKNPGFEEIVLVNRLQTVSTKTDQNQSPDLPHYVPMLLPVEKSLSANTESRLHQPATSKPSIMSEINNLISFLKSKNKKSQAPFKPYWSVTAFASNDWSQYSLDNDEEDNTGTPQNEMEKISRREKHEASFSAGILATRQFTRRIGLKTGVLYSNIAIAISPQEIYAAKEPGGTINYKYITSSGYGYVKPGFGLPPAIGDSIRSTEAQHNLYTISIPVMVLYKWESGKFSLSPAVGLSANFITKAKIETEIEDAFNKETVIMNRLNGTRNFYAGFIADVNVQYSVNSRWAVNLFPGFKYAITPITKSNVVKTFPYSFNIGAGLTYNF